MAVKSNKKENDDKTLRTYAFTVKRSHPLYPYLDKMCWESKNLYNVTNFYVRQVLTGSKKSLAELTPNEIEVITTLNKTIPAVNEKRVRHAEKRKRNESLKPLDQQKPVKEPVPFELISQARPYLSYELLEAVFREIQQPDYTVTPSHSNQWIMKQVFQDWKSFFASLKEYQAHPEKYEAKPNIPRYAKKSGRKIAYFSNQTCTIKERRYLKFPKTNLVLDLGKIGAAPGRLKQVRVLPRNQGYCIEVVMQRNEKLPPFLSETPVRSMSIDLGIDNFATIINNIGAPPLIVKGKALKSLNYYYNRERAHYYGILRQGKSPTEGPFTSAKLNRLDGKRHNKVKDYFHKASYRILQYAMDWQIDTIVIGKNQHWKKDIKLQKGNKLTFCTIPYALFIDIITYKAREKGIRVIVQEESYTSKASFLDKDEVPVYGDVENPVFSGKRIKRGLYRTATGQLINADINAACNILKKAVPNAFDSIKGHGIKGCVSTPLVLSVA